MGKARSASSPPSWPANAAPWSWPSCATNDAASPSSQVLEALQGDYREELLFVLQQSQDRRAQLARAIAECDVQIQKLCAAVPGEPAPTPAPSETTPTATATATPSETVP